MPLATHKAGCGPLDKGVLELRNMDLIGGDLSDYFLPTKTDSMCRNPIVFGNDNFVFRLVDERSDYWVE